MFLSSFSNDFLFPREPPHTEISGLYFLSHGCQIQARKGCKHGVICFNFLHNTSDFALPYYLSIVLPRFRDSLWGETEKKTVNTTNLRQLRRLLMLDLLKTCPSSSPHLLHFHIFLLFFSNWNLVTQIVAFLYVAYKQKRSVYQRLY